VSEQIVIELLYGQGAHANTPACVEDVPFILSGRYTGNFPHSIWQLVYHMNFWMSYELARIRRQNPAYPEHASESWPANPAPDSEQEWRAAQVTFRDLIGELAKLAESPPDILAERVDSVHSEHEGISSSLLAVLWQILVHNSYHIGQLTMLRRALGAWPPRGGGDSW
jgi:uncharacterized damage-inducible protein DinB